MDSFTEIENGAQGGAMGVNSLPEPTQAQKLAGNYKMGRVAVHGLSVAIENPRNTYRSGVDSSGKAWSNRMAAHYGYFSGTKGADGDGIDVFLGHVPESERVFVINQINPKSGSFDEHKIMLCFPDLFSAKAAYLHSYDRGWDGLGSIVEISLTQLKWWIKHGNKQIPLSIKTLPVEGYMTQEGISWANGENGGMPLNSTLDSVLYGIRQDDHGQGLIFDSLTLAEVLDDADEYAMLDAMVVPFAKIEQKMNVLLELMRRSGGEVKATALQISDPFKQRGVSNVAALFELSDGQTITAFFHNPDVNPSKLGATDELISWKWMLNKKDITIVVAPEKGTDLNPREVARRMIKLAEKNSKSFKAVNAKRSERMANIEALKEGVAQKEIELARLQTELEEKKAKREAEKAAELAKNTTRYSIGKSKKNAVKISMIGVADGEKVYQCDMANDGTGTYTRGHLNDVMEWLSGMLFVGGGSYDKVRETLKLVSGEDVLKVVDKGGATTAQGLNSDISYKAIDDMFTAFYPNTPAGEDAWKKIAELTDGTGKVLHTHVNSTVQQLSKAGYTVSKDIGTQAKGDDELLAELAASELTNEVAPAIEVKPEIKINGVFGDLSLSEQLKDKGFLSVVKGDKVFLGKLNKATGNAVIQQYANNTQANNAVEKLSAAGFDAHVTAKHPFCVVISGFNGEATTEAPKDGVENPQSANQAQELSNEVAAITEDELTSNAGEDTPSPVAVKGNELGDFPDTEEGKKAFRTKAKEFLYGLRGTWVDCASIGRKVEIRTRGIKEALAYSADIRKLKMLPSIKAIIATAFNPKIEENFKKDSKPHVISYLRLKNSVMLEGSSIPVEVVIEEDDKGLLHYDFILDPDDAQTKTALDSSSAAVVSGVSTNHNSANTDNVNIERSLDDVNCILDSAASKVINLFIVGEDAEVISVDIDEPIDSDVQIQAAIDDPIKSRAWELSTDVVKGLTEDGFQLICTKLTAENFHPENLVFMAKRVGTEDQLIEANFLNRSAARLSIDDYFKRRDKLSTDLHAAQTAAFKAMAATMEPTPEPKEIAPFEDDEQASYKPFSANSLKMPTAEQLGVGASSKGILRLFKDANEVQVDGWTNGHVLDVFSEPPLITEAQKAIEEGSGKVAWLDYARVEQIVNQAKAHSVPLAPVASYEYTADEGSKRYAAIAALQGKSAIDIKSVVIGNEAENLALHINKFYFAYFVRTYKGAEFFTDKDGGNVLVKHRNKIVGVLMPIRLKGQSTGREDNAENMARAKQASAQVEAEKEVDVTPNEVKEPIEIDLMMDIDRAAAMGYQAGLTGQGSIPDGLKDELRDAWNIGFKKGKDEAEKSVINHKYPIGFKWESAEYHTGLITREVVAHRSDGGYEVANNGKEAGAFGNEILSESMLDQDVEFAPKAIEDFQRREEDRKQEAIKETEKQAEYNDVDGFADAMSAMQKGKTLTTLNAIKSFNGNAMTVKESIRARIANGATITIYDGKRILENPDESFIDESKLTKTGMDYAEFLISKKPVAEAQGVDEVEDDKKPKQKTSTSPLDEFESSGGEAWQVTRSKWVEIMQGHMAMLGQSEDDHVFEAFHKSQVKDALDAGKLVPPEVLMDYPDMKPETQKEKDARYADAENAMKNIISAAAGEKPSVDTSLSALIQKREAEIAAVDAEHDEIKAQLGRELAALDSKITVVRNKKEKKDDINNRAAEARRDHSEKVRGILNAYDDVIKIHPEELARKADSARKTAEMKAQIEAEKQAKANQPAQAAHDHADDIAFMQSVIDGKADIWASDLAGKLEGIYGRIKGDPQLEAQCMKAINAYATQAMTLSQKTLTG